MLYVSRIKNKRRLTMSEKQLKQIKSQRLINHYVQQANFATSEADRMYYEMQAQKELNYSQNIK